MLNPIEQQYLLGAPILALAIFVEMYFSWRHQRHLYTTGETALTVYIGILNLLVDKLITYVGGYFLLDWLYKQYHLVEFSNPWIYWPLLVILEDFAYYALHWLDHHSRFFWAVHVTHHNSVEFNLTTGFRASVFQPLYRFIFFIPLVLLGFKGVDILIVFALTQNWGNLVHTRLIGKLGFLEWFMVTPSHHRVHHGSNVRYLDRNMGMTFIIWDRLFGTFQEEVDSDPVVYGLTKNPEDRGPVNIVLHEWKAIWKDATQPRITPAQRLMYIFGPPGWSHDGRSHTSDELRRQMGLEA